MTQLNLKLIEIVPEKIVVIDGKQYLILGDAKVSSTEKKTKEQKSTGKRAYSTPEDTKKRREAILAVVRDTPGLNKQEIIAEIEKRFGLVLNSGLWNAAQNALKNEGHLRSEWINEKQPLDGARYYAVSSNASENLKRIDPELERLLAEEEEIERRGKADEMGREDPSSLAYHAFAEQAASMRAAGKSNLEIAVCFGIDQETVEGLFTH